MPLSTFLARTLRKFRTMVAVVFALLVINHVLDGKKYLRSFFASVDIVRSQIPEARFSGGPVSFTLSAAPAKATAPSPVHRSPAAVYDASLLGPDAVPSTPLPDLRTSLWDTVSLPAGWPTWTWFQSLWSSLSLRAACVLLLVCFCGVLWVLWTVKPDSLRFGNRSGSPPHSPAGRRRGGRETVKKTPSKRTGAASTHGMVLRRSTSYLSEDASSPASEPLATTPGLSGLAKRAAAIPGRSGLRQHAVDDNQPSGSMPLPATPTRDGLLAAELTPSPSPRARVSRRKTVQKSPRA